MLVILEIKISLVSTKKFLCQFTQGVISIIFGSYNIFIIYLDVIETAV